MTFDPKYGYTRIENKSFTLGGHAAPRRGIQTAAMKTRRRAERATGITYSAASAGSGTGARKYSTRRRYTGYTRSSPASRSPTSARPAEPRDALLPLAHGTMARRVSRVREHGAHILRRRQPPLRHERWAAHCIFCGADVAGSAEKFHELWRPAKALIDEAEREKRRFAEQSAPPAEKPREDFRAISRRWRRDYDEKSEAELEQAARERGERREAERLRARSKTSEKAAKR